MEGKKSKYSSGFKVRDEAKKPLAYKPKRGPLSKLMSEEEKQNAGIHELSYDFGCRITRLFQYLTEDAEYKEFVQSKQVYRSGTSIGANVRESKHAQSDADLTDGRPLSRLGRVKASFAFTLAAPSVIFENEHSLQGGG